MEFECGSLLTGIRKQKSLRSALCEGVKQASKEIVRKITFGSVIPADTKLILSWPEAVGMIRRYHLDDEVGIPTETAKACAEDPMQMNGLRVMGMTLVVQPLENRNEKDQT